MHGLARFRAVQIAARSFERFGDKRLATLAAFRESPFFTERERAALEWTEAVTLVAQTHVPDAAWDTARAVFTDDELLDLTLAITLINSWNRFAVAFRKLPAA